MNGIILAVLSLVILRFFYARHISRLLIVFNIVYLGLLLVALCYDMSLLNARTNQTYKQSTEYNDIVIEQYGTRKLLSMNGSNSSSIDIATGRSYFGYIQDITRIIDEQKPKRILII